MCNTMQWSFTQPEDKWSCKCRVAGQGKSLENGSFFPGQIKVREFWFESGKFAKRRESQGNSNFPEKQFFVQWLFIS